MLRRVPVWLPPAALATVLTVPFLGRTPLWADEVDSASAAGRSLPALARLLRHQDAPLGAYYAFLHVWIRAGGSSAGWLRLPSTLAVVLAVALTAELGRRVAGVAVGIAAGTLLAANPFVGAYAVDARPYGITVAAAVAATLLLLDPAPPRRRRQWAYGAVLVVGAAAHLFFLLLIPAHALGLVAGRRRLRPWLVAVVAALLVLSPLLVLAAGETAEVGYLSRPTVLSWPGWFQAMAGGTPWLAVPAAGLLLAAFTSRRSLPRGEVPLLMAWLLVPGPVLLLVSVVHPLYLGRYVVESAPALALLAAIGGRALWHRAVGAARTQSARLLVAGLTAVAVTTTVHGQLVAYRYENPRAAADVVLDDAAPGEGLVYLPPSVRTTVGWYLDRLDRSSPRPADVLLDPTGSQDAVGNFGGRNLPAGDAVRNLLRHQVVWLVRYDSAAATSRPARAVLAVLQRCYQLGSARSYGQLIVARETRIGRC